MSKVENVEEMENHQEDQLMSEMAKLARKDAREMAKGLSRGEVRYLVDFYYQLQDFRKAAGNRAKAADKADESHNAIDWALTQMAAAEDSIRKVMDAWTDNQRAGRWAKSQTGIGPVLAAGCLATFSPDRPTVGSWWRFAGLDPTLEWLGREKAEALVKELDPAKKLAPQQLIDAAAVRLGRSPSGLLTLSTPKNGKVTRESVTSGLAKRPYNADAKVLAWKIADSFVRLGDGEPDPEVIDPETGKRKRRRRVQPAHYATWYRERKAYELNRDTTGGNAATAAATLETRRLRDRDLIEKYESGHLPDGRIDLRARRWVAKLFLAHLHWVSYESEHGVPPPKPYAIDILKHAHLIAPPGWPCD